MPVGRKIAVFLDGKYDYTISSDDYLSMTHAASGPGLSVEPFQGHLRSRLLKIALALLLAGLAFLLAG